MMQRTQQCSDFSFYRKNPIKCSALNAENSFLGNIGISGNLAQTYFSKQVTGILKKFGI